MNHTHEGEGAHGLEYFLERLREKAATPSVAPVLVVAFGDSVTQGCMEEDVIDPVHVYHNVLKQMLDTKYPRGTLSILNAGISGETAADGRRRLECDVISHHPDLVIVGFCLNDACTSTTDLVAYRENLTSIVREIRARTAAAILFLTPNFMAARETEQISKNHRVYVKPILRCQNEGILRAHVQILRETGRVLGVPVADVYARWEGMAAAGLDTTAMLSNGLNHPDAPRQRLIAETIFALLEQAEAPGK
jgi:lysophospholipase L1-like esterase